MRRIAGLLGLALAACAPAQPSTPEAAAPRQRTADSTAPTSVATAPVDSAAPTTLVGPPPTIPVGLSPDLEKLWRSRITGRLKREQWKTSNRYDAGSLYMIPLQAAFERTYEPGQREFADHVARFYAWRDSVELKPELQLSWLQYLYFISRFTALAAAHDKASLIPDGLPGTLHGWVSTLWQKGPAWQWYRKPFPGGVRERIDWKLSGARGVKGHAYERAVLDQELFLFAIAADLRQYGRIVGSPLGTDPVLLEIERYARRTYADRVMWGDDGGWTFQTGVWRDHPDHAYGCREEKRPGLESCSDSKGAEDASHSHRLPLVLRSMAEAQPAGSEGRAYYSRLLQGLERQFFARVAVPPSAEFGGWRLRNFMDGGNGIYRWQYRSLGPNQGFGPYELSGILLHGWWAFLPSERAGNLYRALAAQFPLREELMAIYGGPLRKAGSPGILSDGTTELLCRLASDLVRSGYEGS